MGRSKVELEAIFGHLEGADMRFRFKQTKNLGKRDRDMHNY
jgi:hypothetical protein